MLSPKELTQIHTTFEDLKKLSHDNLGFVVKPILLSFMIRTKLSSEESPEWRKYVYSQYRALYNEISWSNQCTPIGILKIVKTLFRGNFK